MFESVSNECVFQTSLCVFVFFFYLALTPTAFHPRTPPFRFSSKVPKIKRRRRRLKVSNQGRGNSSDNVTEAIERCYTPLFKIRKTERGTNYFELKSIIRSGHAFKKLADRLILLLKIMFL